MRSLAAASWPTVGYANQKWAEEWKLSTTTSRSPSVSLWKKKTSADSLNSSASLKNRALQAKARPSQSLWLLSREPSLQSSFGLTRHEPTELEKDLIRKAKEMSINPKEGENPAGADETKLFEDPDFIKDVLRDLNLDPESKEAKDLIENMSKQKAEDKDQSKKGAMDEEKKE